MSTQILNYPITMFNSNNHSGRIKRLKTDDINQPCQHINRLNNWCIWCGKTLDVPFDYIPNDVRPYNNVNSQLHNPKVNSLLNQKKLYLVLDLDHTLLNTTRLTDLSLDEEYLKDGTISSLFRLDKIGMITKLRPFVHRFLQEASRMFELCIYTMGDRAYALEMAKLLDPENQYFKSRIISKNDNPERDQKELDVLKIPESLVIVLDDTKVVWQKNKENLILMDRYCYFSSSCRNFGYKNCKSLSQLRRDEDECDGALANILRVLIRIHREFYDNHENTDDRDVRQMLKTAKHKVLRGCKIVFSGVFPRNYAAGNHTLWKMAAELGAICSTELDSCVTHVVSTNGDTEKSRWAVREGKFLVHPRWIEAAYYLWRRHLEDKFPVKVAKCSSK